MSARAYSYSYLCKKAGLAEPGDTSLAQMARNSRRRRNRAGEQKAWLRVQLDGMVARGELVKTAEGKYDLPTTS